MTSASAPAADPASVAPAGGRSLFLLASVFALRWALARWAPANATAALVVGVAGLGAWTVLCGALLDRFAGTRRAPAAPPPRSRMRVPLLALLLAAPAVLGVAYVRAVSADVAPSSSLDAGPGLEAVVGLLMTAGVGPWVEERYFRGLVHREFVVLFGRPWMYVLANAAWFTAVHPPALMPIALLVGLACATLRTLSGSIAPAFAAHALTNLALDLLAHLT